MDKEKVLSVLNDILEHELSGVVRYTHYSFMVFGHNRIPIVKWLREQGQESLLHAEQAGELVTSYGGHPSLKIKDLLETHKHAIGDILQESLDHEEASLVLYQKLHDLTEGKDILLEEFAKRLICEEQTHASEVKKMLRAPK